MVLVTPGVAGVCEGCGQREATVGSVDNSVRARQPTSGHRKFPAPGVGFTCRRGKPQGPGQFVVTRTAVLEAAVSLTQPLLEDVAVQVRRSNETSLMWSEAA